MPPMQKNETIPAGLADKWERMTAVAAQRLAEKRKRIKEAVGVRPYKGLPVSDAERLARYSQVRRDPQALLAVLQENAKFKPDGTVLVPKALIATMATMEKRIREDGVA